MTLRLPAINVPQGIDPALRDALAALKEHAEVWKGARGNPLERLVTLRELEAATQQATGRGVGAAVVEIGAAGASQVPQNIGSELAQLRTEMANSERSTTSRINQLTQSFGGDSGGLSSVEAMAKGAVSKYTRGQLSSDLASGAAKIIAGATSGNSVMELAADGSHVLFKHKLANIGGLGAGYTGTVRTAVGITAAGFLAGYNRLSDGAWQNSVVIDSATGDVTILGTLKASSVLEAGVTVGVGGTLIGTVATNASTAITNATAAQTAANTANAAITAITSDGVLSKGEKSGAILYFNQITAELTGIRASADSFVVSRTAFDAAHTALNSYLTGLSPAWNDTSTDTTINPTTYRAAWGDYYSARQSLLNAIAAKAKTLADAAQATASTALGNAATAQATANGKLTAQSSYILGSDFALKTSGYDAGSGIILTNTGLLGKKAGTTTFAIDTNGDATFLGAITSGSTITGATITAGSLYIGSGAFQVSTAGVLTATGAIITGNITGASNIEIIGGAKISGSKSAASFLGHQAAIVANDGGSGSVNGLIALTTNASAIGASIGYSLSSGVPGGYFSNSTPGGEGLEVDGAFRWNSYLYASPDGVSSTFMCRNGTWAAISSGNVTTALGFTPVSASGTIANATTAATATNANNLNGLPESSYARNFVCNVGTATVAGSGLNLNCTISGYEFSGATNVVTLQAISDRRLKQDITPESLGLSFIEQLNPVTYRMRASPDMQYHGFIYDEVALVLPREGDSLNQRRPEGYGGVDYMSLIGPLVKAVQQLSTRLNVLEKP